MTASDGTIWVVTDTTDHGEPFGDHEIIRKAAPFLYEELVHIPLIIRHPEEKQDLISVKPQNAMELELEFRRFVSDLRYPVSHGAEKSFNSPMQTPILSELDWDANEVWRGEHEAFHHDMSCLPNGNTLVLVWEALPEELAIKDEFQNPDLKITSFLL